jgi:hypothetical protein
MTHAVDELEPATVREALHALAAHPGRLLRYRWNWKSAALSTAVRGGLFFVVNLQAGLPAAVGALVTELWFRSLVAGACSAVVQSFRRARPRWQASAAVLVVLPILAHSAELAVHWWTGTVELGESELASVLFTIVSTLFTLFAMQRGAFIVGRERRSLGRDLASMPSLAVAFVATGVSACLWPLRRERHGPWADGRPDDRDRLR